MKIKVLNISAGTFKYDFSVFYLFIFVLSYGFLGSQNDPYLIASYYFSGNARDTIANLHGTVHGASLATDRFGNANAAYCFDGENDYISLGTNSDLKQGKMSISLWVKINGYNNSSLNYPGMPIIQTRVRDEVQYYEAYAMSMFLENHKFTASNISTMQQLIASMSRSAATIDEWYHLAYMFDHDSTYLYVNGQLEQKNFKGFVSSYLSTDSVVLGFAGNHRPDTFKYRNYSWLNGCIDDLKFFSKVLSADQVLALYKESDPKFGAGNTIKSRIKLWDVIVAFWYIPLLLLLLMILTLFVFRFRLRQIRLREQKEYEIEKKLAQLEMKALRSQMNPHFIFNALNSIQHYVLTNEKERANKYLVKFSQLMRNILELSTQELVSLKEELETIKLYLDIESLRFNEAFSYSLNISENINTEVIRLPPLIIQPFVENAIWHGLLLKEGTKVLLINVFAEENAVIIEIDDNGIGRKASNAFLNDELKRRSFGLEITQDRLEILEKVFGVKMTFDVIDKKDTGGMPLGTLIKLKIVVNNLL